MSKLVVLDSGFLTHQAIFLYGASIKRNIENGTDNFVCPSHYNYLNSIYSVLKKIGITRNDRVLVAKDGWNSWRKAFLVEYKAQRKEYRDSHDEINWKKEYGLINKIEEELEIATNWNFVQFNEQVNFADLCLTKEGKELGIENHNIDYSKEFGFEADDVMALCPVLFPDYEVVLVTIDKDINQCCYYENCKVFNPRAKSVTNKAKSGYYEVVDDALDIIKKKVKSGDKSDNIIVDKNNDTIIDIEVREFIINLLKLPDWLSIPIAEKLTTLNWNKQVLYDKLPLPNSLGKKFDSIYNSKETRSYEESVKNHLKREEIKKEKAKKAQEKRKAKSCRI